MLHFLSTRPLRKPDEKLGSYIPTSQQGHATVRRELLTYFGEITPWTQIFADKLQTEDYLHPDSEEDVYSKEDGWVQVLMQRLARYELTKGEVVMILNLGLGLEDWEARMPLRLRGGTDGASCAEEQRASDEAVLGAVCEELEQRFGPDEIQGILKTVEEVVSEGKRAGENGGGGPTVASKSSAKHGTDENEDAEMEEE